MTKASSIFVTGLACAALGAAGLTACTVTTVDSPRDDAGTIIVPNDASTKSDASSGSDAGADVGTGVATCPSLQVFGGACDTCLSAKCAASFCTCFAVRGDPTANDDCNKLDDCVGACLQADGGLGDGGVSGCIEVCTDVHPNSKALYAGYQGCSLANCAAECK